MNFFQSPPDTDSNFIPFTITRLILENFADFSLNTIHDLIKKDLYKLYIKRGSTPTRVLYDSTKLSRNHINLRENILADFKILTSRLIPGDTLVIQMAGPKGYSVHANFTLEGKWSCRFFHHPEYYHHPSLKPNIFVIDESVEIDSSSIQSVKGSITTDDKNQLYRQSLKVTLSDDTIIIVILDSKPSKTYEIYLDVYGQNVIEGHLVWVPIDINADWTVGWKFLKWLDMAITWKKYYEGGDLVIT